MSPGAIDSTSLDLAMERNPQVNGKGLKNDLGEGSSRAMDDATIRALYSPSITAKIWGIASRALSAAEPPAEYPEYTKPGSGKYVYRELEFWTSGFFPGILYLLYARRQLYGSHLVSTGGRLEPHTLKLHHACKWWTHNLHSQASRLDTHDLGFMIHPWASLGWELDGDQQCRTSMISAAKALVSRFDSRIGCIRSWDVCHTKTYSFTATNKADHFLVIIDNMLNLDMLYYVSELTGDKSFADIATAHARTTMKSHIRDDDTTWHVANFDQTTGDVMSRFTHQGYNDDSCWARGQAWGVAGFAEAYKWTKDETFRNTSARLANWFIDHLPDDCVPYWDFSDPKAGTESCPRDASAGLVAAWGMLLLYQNWPKDDLASAQKYLDASLRIISGTLKTCLTSAARLVTTSSGNQDVDLGGFETILAHSTINNNEFASRRWADHGLVYADYYLVLISNKLIEMGLVTQV